MFVTKCKYGFKNLKTIAIVTSLCERFGLPKTATWDDLLVAARDAKKQIAKKFKIQLPKELPSKIAKVIPDEGKMQVELKKLCEQFNNKNFIK